MEASTISRTRLVPRSRRLLAAFGDDRVVSEARRGNHVAFEVIYDRYHRPLLAFCRHMLRSREDAEDALQHTFASAFRTMQQDERPIDLKPWLYTIARNRCFSVMRARREQPVEEIERVSTAGLADEVEQRDDLKALLTDLEELPERQRAALVLSEVGDLGHSDIAEILECETKQVKALVFQARTSLMESRRAREIPCAEIREQLATGSGGELRRGVLRRHVRGCPGCAEFRDEVRRQRKMLAVVLPVIPSIGLKESALAAAGVGGGGAAGGGGLIAALGAHSAAKAVAITVASGGTVGGAVAVDPSLVEKTRVAVARAASELGTTGAGTGTGSASGNELENWTEGAGPTVRSTGTPPGRRPARRVSACVPPRHPGSRPSPGNRTAGRPGPPSRAPAEGRPLITLGAVTARVEETTAASPRARGRRRDGDPVATGAAAVARIVRTTARSGQRDCPRPWAATVTGRTSSKPCPTSPSPRTWARPPAEGSTPASKAAARAGAVVTER